MRLVIIPPYQNPIVNWTFILRELLADAGKRGQLAGVTADIDEGAFTESTSESRDEESRANMSAGLIRKAREYARSGQHDAIILTGGTDPAFAAARLAANIPVTASLHSALHAASLIGERCSLISLTASSALAGKHCAVTYGLDHKLASARYVNYSTTAVYKLLLQYQNNWEERLKDAALIKVIDDLTVQCLAAVEKDRVDSLVISVEPMEALEKALRQRLDAAGYEEIPLISGFAAALEMAKTLVNMKIIQAPRAYPGATLKAKPEYW
jgi:Asp/Glu/hydantoin racemase